MIDPKAHNKAIVIDRAIVLTGSFNFTNDAGRDAENLLVLRNQRLAREYLKDWKMHRQHCERYSGGSR